MSLYTVSACRGMTTSISHDWNDGRHRTLTCSCGWEMWTLADKTADRAATQVESQVHRQVAAASGWNHPRGRIIAWVS